MKKSPNSLRKLALHRQAIVALTPLKLTDVAGGVTRDGDCNTVSRALAAACGVLPGRLD